MFFGTNQTFKIKLSGSVATNQCPWVALAISSSNTATASNGVTNNTSDVTVVSATSGALKWFNLRNADTASITLIGIYDDNGTQRNIFQIVMDIGDHLEVNSTGNWQVRTSSGGVKQSGGITGALGSTANRLIRVNGTGGSSIQAGVDVTLDDSGFFGIGVSGSADRAIHLGAGKSSRSTIYTLTDGATITMDMTQSNLFEVTLNGSRTLANPSNLQPGQTGCVFIAQNGTGSNTLAYGSYWDFVGGVTPVLSTPANSVDRLDYIVRSTTSIHAVLSKAIV
jgi:hypothetical protein